MLSKLLLNKQKQNKTKKLRIIWRYYIAETFKLNGHCGRDDLSVKCILKSKQSQPSPPRKLRLRADRKSGAPVRCATLFKGLSWHGSLTWLSPCCSISGVTDCSWYSKWNWSHQTKPSWVESWMQVPDYFSTCVRRECWTGYFSLFQLFRASSHIGHYFYFF